MLDLSFRVQGAAAVPFAASPQMAFAVRLACADAACAVQSALIRCQIQIDAPARAYSEREAEGLRDLFGEGPVWGRALRRVLWTHATAVVPGFTGETTFEVHAPCTYDLCVASAKYFHALEQGDVPVALLFSGTVFHVEGGDAAGALRAAPVPWTSEARFPMPVGVWKEAVDHYYAGRAALPISREVLARLERYKARAGLATWDAAIDQLLPRDAGGAGAGGAS